MPTARQSAKFSAGCRRRAPPGEHARPTRRRPVAAVGQRTVSECLVRAAAAGNRFCPVLGITRRRAGRLLTFEEGASNIWTPLPMRENPASQAEGITLVPNQDTCRETGHVQILDRCPMRLRAMRCWPASRPSAWRYPVPNQDMSRNRTSVPIRD